MLKRFVLVAALASFAVAGSVTKLPVHQVTLVKPAVLNGAALKPGDYKLVVGDAKVILTPKEGGNAMEAPVKIVSAPTKFDVTVITYQTESSGDVISEIDLGGSKTKLMFAQ
jgi:hypothetical protein